MEHPEFVHLIADWYLTNKRELPWRQEKSPYRIWLSEILLQQTRVSQGLPYYYNFVNEFPDITSLAESDEEKVLRLWQGLGYYSRARNLHFTAKEIVRKYNGIFPNTYKELLKLKGVGEYTAAAIASFAFNEKVAVLDGNVFRVLSRVFGIEVEINSPKGKKAFRNLADSLLPEKGTDTYNQAIMEFGALQCTPGLPDCNNCPLSHFCYAKIHQQQKKLPVKFKPLPKKKRCFQYHVYKCNDHILMQERNGKDIWNGLYQFPLIERTNLAEDSAQEYTTPIIYRQILSHQIIEACFIQKEVMDLNIMKILAEKLGAKVYSLSETEALPKPVLINNYLKDYIF